MQITLPYGRGELLIRLPDSGVDLLVPRPSRPLEDPRETLRQALRRPQGTQPLAHWAKGARSACIVISDWTRPTPNHLLVPWLLAELADLTPPPPKITLLVAAGTHEPPEQWPHDSWWGDLGPGVEVVIHRAQDEGALIPVGRSSLGEIRLNRAYVSAELRIITGFIEPHFFAGYSGGGKALMPGIAALENILRLHGPEFISHPRNTWYTQEGNPTHAAIVQAVELCPPHFLVNVTLDRSQRITGCFAGDWQKAHAVGRDFCARYSRVAVNRSYPLVLTTNGGYPLDQNLYQTVKGMSAAARIAQPGGDLIVASACQAGLPPGGNFQRLLEAYPELDGLLSAVQQSPAVLDQWEAQVLARIVARFRVHLYSQLDPNTVRRCFLEPVHNLEATVQELRRRHGSDAVLAVLPLGPLAVPG